MIMSYYVVTKNDQQIGPISEEELADGVQKGKFSTNNLVWKDGMADWQPINIAFPTLNKTTAAVPPPPPKRTPELKKKKSLNKNLTVMLCLIGLAVIGYNANLALEKYNEYREEKIKAVYGSLEEYNEYRKDKIKAVNGSMQQIKGYEQDLKDKQIDRAITTASPQSIGELVQFEDSEWIVIEARQLGSSLRSEFSEPKKSEGKFVYVRFKVKNITNQEESILFTPALIDSKGRRFEQFAEQFLYLSEGEEPMPMEQLPSGLPKNFSAIFELPNDATGISFLTRDFKTFGKNEIPVNLGF